MRLRGTGGDRPLHRENHPVRRAADADLGFRRANGGGTGRAAARLIAHLHVSADFSRCSAVKQSG